MNTSLNFIKLSNTHFYLIITKSPPFIAELETLSNNSLVSTELFESVSISTEFGEGNGTPLQYSCLENPMDGGAW